MTNRDRGRQSDRSSIWLLALAGAGGLAASLLSGTGEGRHDAAEAQAQVVETLALSSVAAAVPGREAVRQAQALAILEARRLGIDLSIASLGSGGRQSGDASADARAFARLAERFPETIAAAESHDNFRERLSKAWVSDSKALAHVDSYNGSSEIISDPLARMGACVVELRAPGETLRAMLGMAYADSAAAAIEHKAHSLGVTAADVAFLVAGHESSHCVIGMARKAGLLDTSWADPAWKVPPAWLESRGADDHDSPALAKTEESAADLLAVLWAGKALGQRKARNLARLVIYARSRGARLPLDDRLHDSSKTLRQFLALGPTARRFALADPSRYAWQTATSETRKEIVESGGMRLAMPPPR